MLAAWKKNYDQPRQHIKKQRHYFTNKGLSSQSYGFSSSHVWIWELDYKESWAPNNRCFWTVVLEKTLESPLGCKEIKSVNLKGNQSWNIHWKTDTKAEAPILWPHDVEELALQKRPWCWERLKAGGEGDNRGWWDGWMASLTQWTWVWASSERVMDRKAWHAAVHGVTKSWTRLSELNLTLIAPRIGMDRIFFICS